MQFPINRILLTGAAGGLGKVLRPRLAQWCNVLRVSGRSNLGTASANEEIAYCDLADTAGVMKLLEGVDAVVHMGGVSVDGPWKPILAGNIVGMHNLYEAARVNGTRRIFYASSNHAIGFHKQSETLDAQSATRPDGNYGLSKVFGEAVAQLYWDRYGIETVSCRIGSSFTKPVDRRMMCTWFSYDDLTELIRCSFAAEKVEHTMVYGVSANKVVWWNNDHARHLGWVPKDSSEIFRAEIEALPAVAPTDPVAVYQGGKFTALGPYPIGE